MTGGERRLDLVLDGGRVGLRFFAEHLPRAERYAPGLPPCSHLEERYDEQRGTDPAVLLVDADVFARLETGLDAEVARQRSGVDALATAWTGGGAAGAVDALVRHVRAGEDLRAGLGTAHRALTDAAAAVLAVVEEKARAAAEFADTTVGGRTVEEIDAILAGAADGDGPTARQLAAWDPALGPDLDRAAVTHWCARWRDEVYRPGVEAAVESFLALCDDTDRAVRAVFAELVTMLAPPDPAVRDVGPVTDPWAPPGASTDLVAAGLRLVTAVGGLTGAVLDLAATVVEEVTEAVETAIPAPPDPARAPSHASDSQAGTTATEPEPPTPVADSGHVVPGHVVPGQDAAGDGTAEHGASGPDTSAAPLPPDPQRAGASGDGVPPAPAGIPGPRADTARRTGTAGAEGADPNPEQEAGDGVVLAEAGPL
ncbi:hypothetical protein [Rhodococcus ruber]|uniref:hypothetical protein n=1 Tax=Rhodococcus ruber TaxID=1830 RepID=UPI0007CD6458|nr:hypothetical protein [Rhodococcus ruber]AWG99992.1 hypothetical protein DCN13_16320 [Rhodococcus ruber]